MKPVTHSSRGKSACYKILLVDDDKLVIDSFERAFQEHRNDFIIEKTTDSTQALKLIEKNPYDIIITDLVMPGVDGIQLLKEAKEIQPEAEIILITAYSSYSGAIDAMYFGACDYISKPINFSDLKVRITRALNKRKAIIEKNNKILEMERLFYTIAHDFKATILSIKSFSEILEKEYIAKLNNEECHFLISRINANVSIMESITEGLLEYSKIGKLEEEWGKIHTEALVREIADNYSPALKEHNITLKVETPLPDVYFYERGMRRIFSNLIDNSIKYAQPDIPSHIKIGISPAEDVSSAKYCHFYIEDNGIGIEPNNLELIFEPFQRENSNAHKQGYGIGLAIVKKILETAHCSIKVKSIKNEKTVFHFTLPKVDSRISRT